MHTLHSALSFSLSTYEWTTLPLSCVQVLLLGESQLPPSLRKTTPLILDLNDSRMVST